MKKTKTKIEKQLRKKTNPVLVNTIIAAKKNPKWTKIAGILSGPGRIKTCINLSEIDKKTKKGEKIVIPGKVLSQGDVSKKIKISAFKFSKRAEEKLKKAGCETNTILNEIKSNPDAKDIKVIR
ncbi:50S ribosomal protein L18e [Candidatus Pacearchaeota archaeon]|nr:50S ribosomal protein L18e [Candidatus Pacearchaeota archaeon]